MNKYMEEARAIRASINGLSVGADDETLVENKAAFPYWNGNEVLYAKGDLVQYDDKLYRVEQAHTSEPNWTPDITPALFTEISLDEYPEWKQPTGAQDAYKKGDKCSHKDKHWISDVDNNVWEPSVYGWTEIEPNAD